MNRWVETTEHLLQSGRWAPEARVVTDHGSSIEHQAIIPGSDITFATREDARAFSMALGQKWVAENG